jgi:hypothetical protein
MVEGEFGNELEPIAEQLHHVAWVHGTSLHLEATEAIEATARGRGTTVRNERAASDEEAWVHFAIPSISVISNVDLAIRAVILDFTTSQFAEIDTVDVWDGGTRIASFDGLNLSGHHPFAKLEFSDGAIVDFQRGIGVSVKVLLYNPVDSPGEHAIFRSAGAEFVIKAGIR